MAGFSGHNLAFAFGLLGNVISFFVFLSPLPTFYQIYKKKSTEGFQSVPYIVALFSAMLLMYYAFLKSNATLLITINSFGCFIEAIYIGFYIFYTPKKLPTVKLLSLMMGSFGLILVITCFLVNGPMRVHIVGWICLIFSVSVFAAPLGILKQVMRTKSVEFMPFSLSFSLTLNAVMWFFYGLLIKDFNIAIPNVLGFVFGVLQMVLYLKYKDGNKGVKELKLPAAADQIPSKVVVVAEEKKMPVPEQVTIDMAKLREIILSSEMMPAVVVPNLNGHAMAAAELHLAKPNIEVPVLA
ncbi:bidirectional sugar transporter N3-like [Diospyros lotus]|uniref:bidirectional sugar transporter N3-like n=1 Tax=Diospyros lotus TaxID=55363 RepID=UPI00225476BC|nr:bidirectional sugar transporter N3-like [Diospyros lotus]